MAILECATPVSLGSPQFRTAEYGSLLITDALFPAGHRLERHYHDRAVVGLTLTGGWNSVLGSARLDNVPGMLHVEPAGESHSNDFGSGGAHVLIIQPDPVNPTLMQAFKSLLETASQVRTGTPGILIGKRLRHELLRPDELTCLAIESLSLDLLVLASRSSRSPWQRLPRWLGRVVDYMHAQFLERPTVESLSRIADVSPDHLNREFCRQFRMGPAEYLRGLRLDWTAERLREGNDSVTHIASAAGFADQSHFTRRFRMRFGITPAAFRAASRGPRKNMKPWIKMTSSK
ncbi:MAG TPA: AraC family transcriptional regulator [Candidatus Angelobacter sp.]